MDKKEKSVRLVNVGELESSLKKDLAEEEAKGKSADILFVKASRMSCQTLKTFPLSTQKACGL